MPMTVNGACHCRTVTYTLQSHTPVPYQLCLCTICRKIGGSSGSINIGGVASTLQVLSGHAALRKYSALMSPFTDRTERFPSERNFCGECGSMLWLYDPTFPDLVHPFASSVDTELPEAPNMVCIFESEKPAWAKWPKGQKTVYKEYLDQSLEDWHRFNGVYVE